MTEPVAAEVEEAQGRKMDPEILVMSRMLRMIEELGEAAKARVMAYLLARYRAAKETDQ